MTNYETPFPIEVNYLEAADIIVALIADNRDRSPGPIKARIQALVDRFVDAAEASEKA